MVKTKYIGVLAILIAGYAYGQIDESQKKGKENDRAFQAMTDNPAAPPELIYGEALSGISANGEWVAGQIDDGSVIIRHLPSGKYWPYFATAFNNYYVGYGQPVSNTGIVVGSTTMSDAAYWKGGEWKQLPVPNEGFISNAVSITPDGEVICGGVGMADFGGDTESTMLYPALWYLQEDGSYGEPIILPHPKYDITGRSPQYISAVAISEDGKTVAGEITDYFGARTEPLVYRCDEQGEWSYTLLGRDMLNPSGIEFPEWPGGLDDDILMPVQEWFMTPEQIAAFVEAFNNWDNVSPPPRYEDFMTPEEILQYQEALEAYYEIMLPWSEKYNEFMAVYREYLSRSTVFQRNNSRLSPDGRYFVITANVRYLDYSGTHPVVFDLDNGEIKILDTKERASVTCITSDYTILASIAAPDADLGTYRAYIYPQMQPGGMLLQDYVKERDPDLYDWMETFLMHEVIMGLNPDGSYATEIEMCTGIPVSTPDMSVILTNNFTYSWIDYPNEPFMSLYMPFKRSEAEGSVEELKSDKAIEEIRIYDLSGRRLNTPGAGFNIVEIFYSDKSKETKKIFHVSR